ncbi:sugar transferase [Ruminococcus sp.]|uniref:sugar transferase n=1 Tax=Ruminococcus sp. TaxID=41978 RepID=UPI00258BF7FF|nr:sugar transferase [Ruminococcus sp.]MCR5020168.1 sugar transferase [Ruminococcus sp.]
MENITKNREQYKRLLNFIAALVIILFFVMGFSYVWYNHYNNKMHDPFWRYGNFLMIGIYCVLYTTFTSLFNGFRLGYSKFMGLFGSQVLGIVSTNALEMVLIALIGRNRMDLSPMVVLAAIQLVFAFPWSYAFTMIYTKMYPPRRLLIVYGNSNAKYLVNKMAQRTDKYNICAAVSCDESLEEIERRILRYEGTIITDIPGDLRNKLVKFCFEHSIRTYINPKLSDIIIRGADDFHLFDTPLLLSRNDGLKFEQRMMKRFFDIALAGIMLIVLMPFMLITALIIKLYDGGPVFYSQVRLTTGGRRFKVLKFRSMITDAEKKGGARLASENDDRITPVGKIIRKIRFDELPQLINILKGDMSFVGPRPERPELAERYELTMPEFKYRLKVKAGLTGYAQIMGKYNTTPYDKLKLDLMYIEHQSIREDLRIILSTVRTVFVPDATEGVDDDKPIETRRDLIGHDFSKDLGMTEEEVVEYEEENGLPKR